MLSVERWAFLFPTYGLATGVDLGLGVTLGLAVGVGLGVELGVELGVTVGVGVDVGVPDAVGLGEGGAIRRSFTGDRPVATTLVNGLEIKLFLFRGNSLPHC
jgi:hypothetical protein